MKTTVMIRRMCWAALVPLVAAGVLSPVRADEAAPATQPATSDVASQAQLSPAPERGLWNGLELDGPPPPDRLDSGPVPPEGHGPHGGPGLTGPRGPHRGRGPMAGPPEEAVPLGPHGPTSAPMHPLTEQRIEELLEIVRSERPEMHTRLIEARQSRPGMFDMMMRRIDAAVRRLEDMPPELRKIHRRQRDIRIQQFRLLKAYRQAGDETGRRRLREQIARTVEEEFEIRLHLDAHRLDQLARRLEQLRQQNAERARQRDRLVRQRTERLVEAATGHGRPAMSPATQPEGNVGQ